MEEGGKEGREGPFFHAARANQPTRQRVNERTNEKRGRAAPRRAERLHSPTPRVRRDCLTSAGHQDGDWSENQIRNRLRGKSTSAISYIGYGEDTGQCTQVHEMQLLSVSACMNDVS